MPESGSSDSALLAKRPEPGPAGFGDAEEERNAAIDRGQDIVEDEVRDLAYENPNDLHNPFLPYRFD